jgi:hypothetical protein
MDKETKQKILDLLDQHRIITVATNRPDGWSQATTVWISPATRPARSVIGAIEPSSCN